MARDIVNFNAGPAGLPTSVLERAREELLDYRGTGMSIMEHSHRGPSYDEVHNRALKLVRELLDVPASHDVLLVQGGASGMFAVVPLNFLHQGKTADYVVTGAWSKKALQEAKTVGQVSEAGGGATDGAFIRVPRPDEIRVSEDSAYLHLTSNNTIAGTQFSTFPVGRSSLVADMSSDILSRRLNIADFSLIYAGAQKNLGPSGLTLVIAAKEFIAAARDDIPKIFQLRTHAEKNSLYHTPPTFAVYVLANVLEWIGDLGGVKAIEARNEAKAATLYQAIDQSGGFFRSPVEKESRSLMNVVFRLPDESLEKNFIEAADKKGLVGLKGHRSVGGVRASIYNAVDPEGVERLADFMVAFAKDNG